MVPETLQCKQFELANTPVKTEPYLGLDVHKEWILVAVAEWGRKGAVQDLGTISNDLHALEKLLARLRKHHGPDVVMGRLLRSQAVRVYDCPAFTSARSGMLGGGAFTHPHARRGST
jgi:hypothetical protein